MAYTLFDYSKPDPNDNGATVVNDIRNNLKAVRDGANMGGMPFWEMSYSGADPAKPDNHTWTRKNGIERIRASYTYDSNDDVTQVIWDYYDGSSWIRIGTESFTYDANGNVTQTSWS